MVCRVKGNLQEFYANGCQENLRVQYADLRREIDLWWGGAISNSLRANNLHRNKPVTTATYASYSPEVMETYSKRAWRIHTAIHTNFASKYMSLFTAQVLKNWGYLVAIVARTLESVLVGKCCSYIIFSAPYFHAKTTVRGSKMKPSEVEVCVLDELPNE